MNIRLLLTAAGIALVSTSSLADLGVLNIRETTIKGCVEASDGQIVEVSLELDQVRYRNGSSHKVDIKPESYKLVTSPESFPGSINCPDIAGSGVKVLNQGGPPKMVCYYKKQPGSSIPKDYFDVDKQGSSCNQDF